MELSVNNPISASTSLSNTFQPISFPPPKTHLSTKEAHTLLSNKKVVVFEPDGYFSDEAWIFTILSVLGLSLFSGFIEYSSLTLDTVTFDPSCTAVTPYKCSTSEQDWCNHMGFEKNPDGYILNYTKKELNYDFSEGLSEGIAIALVPPIFVGLVWGILKLCMIASRTLEQEKIDLHNQHINHISNSLNTSVKLDENTVTPFEFIPELIDLELLSDEHYKLLSFEQIETIKKEKPEVFEKLLNDQVFSEEQSQALETFEHLLHLQTAKALLIELNNNQNSEIFENEPRMLEALIQKLSKEHFSDDVKTALALKLGVFKAFETLNIKERIQIIEMMAENKYSFELGIRNFQLQAMKEDEILDLQFFDTDKNPVFIKVSKNLMVQSSSVFKDSLNDCHSAENSLIFETINPKYFQEVISFLLTGKLKSTELEDLLQLFEVAHYLEITELTDKINGIINVNFSIDENVFNELLILSQKLNLRTAPPGIGLKISYSIALNNTVSWFFSDDFLLKLNFLQKFSLYNTLKEIEKLIVLHLEELLKNENFIPRFVEALQIHPKLFSCISLQLHKKPSLLKNLWDEAIIQESENAQDEIILFCNKAKNASIVFINWDLPPKKQMSKKDSIIWFDAIEMEEI